MEYFDKEQINKGRKIAGSIIFIVLVIVTVKVLINLLNDGTQHIIGNLVYLGIASILSFLFYKGYKWTDFMLLIFVVRDVMAVVFFLFQQAGMLPALNGGLMLVTVIIIAVVLGLLIGGSDSLTAFRRYQRAAKRS